MRELGEGFVVEACGLQQSDFSQCWTPFGEIFVLLICVILYMCLSLFVCLSVSCISAYHALLGEDALFVICGDGIVENACIYIVVFLVVYICHLTRDIHGCGLLIC